MTLRYRTWLPLAAALAGISGALLLHSYQPADPPAATWSRGVLHVAIPHPPLRAGQLTVEVLDPEDHVLGGVSEQTQTAPWQADIHLSKSLPVEDLVWHRLRYRFTETGAAAPAVSGTESISQILRMPVLHIIGQQSYLAGGEAAVRVVASDSRNQPISGQSSLIVELTVQGQAPVRLFAGPLNSRGTAPVQFRLPAAAAGRAALHYTVETPIGSAEYTEPIRIEAKSAILLTTEKPVYQPGQTVHLRALALDKAEHRAVAGQPLTFEIEDSRGNKVFKKATQTDNYGIASAEFALADEVNLGAWHLRAAMDGGNTAEIAVNVDRYVLPKYKVAVEFSGKAKHGYRPGDHVTGTVRANYFFGKPVEGTVTVKASAMDVAVFEAATAQGKTDADGAYRFDLKLPDYFAGKPLDQGAARVLVEASVKDSAGHTETRGEPVTVSQSPLLLTAVPEGGTLVPNLENQVFLLASYPDGTPAVAELRAAGQTVTTDAGGVAMIRMKPGDTADRLYIEATDREGNQAKANVPLPVRGGGDQILLRAERAVYRAGEPIRLRVFSTKARGTVYLDVIKAGQTVLTRDVDLVNGQAELALTATPDLSGTLDCNAYLFGTNAQAVADHRLLFVQPADELKVEATADRAVYKPGEDARVEFRVTNSQGEGVQAAIGVQVVDEAVFALAEKQPGFAKVFFYLEQEVMKPRYEIHGIEAPQAITAANPLPARALFAATEIVNPNRFETEAGRTAPMGKFQEYRGRYENAFLAQVRELVKGRSNPMSGPIAQARDAWGTPVQVQGNFVRSAGPDRRLYTADDLTAFVRVTGRVASEPHAHGLDVAIEHDRGPMNGMAEIAGTVEDVTGAAVPNTEVIARSGATTRKSRTGADGHFSIAGLPPGDYRVELAAAGFRLASRNVTLQARDRAVFEATLEIGAVTEMVEVTAAAPAVRFARGGGVAGGVVGGLMQVRALAVAAPMAAPPPPPAPMMAAKGMARDAAAGGVAPAAHVRSYFPEALYINPEIVTDGRGLATVSIPLADSITTWRMALMASTARGALGSGTAGIKVFQDFFVDLDLPVTLTQGDRVSIPVAVYNYSGASGEVALSLKPDAWYSLAGDPAAKSVNVDSGRAGGAEFTVQANRIGKFKLTLAAKMGNRADIVVREIEVVPNGREMTQVFNGRLDSSARATVNMRPGVWREAEIGTVPEPGVVRHAIDFPAGAISDASKVFVRLYPGPLSQVIEGMDAILRMPFGCFEQTSSATYPNVLALDYMKRTKKLTPEVHAKAEGFIVNGYQRLLTYEVPGGGFSWFGNPPANKILTSYGLMEFHDMAQVHDVDPRLIERTQQWLARQQQPDGSWKPDTQFINEGATNRYNSDALRIAAYIGWALESSGYRGPAVAKARQFVERHMGEKTDAYTLAVLANFAVDSGDREFARQAVEALAAARTEQDDQVWWTAPETGVYATGASAAIETTGLAVQALLKSGLDAGIASKALKYIASKKEASGTWGTTQATIMALKALLLATEKGSAEAAGTVEITLNGKPAGRLVLTAENNDLLHQFVLAGIDQRGPNHVELKFTGRGGLAYQVVGRYFLPWDARPAAEPLTIEVKYDRTQLAQNDIATATATVKSNLPATAKMVMVDLGIPPGFDLLTEDLQAYQEQSAGKSSGRMEKFTLTATQATLYFDSLAAGDTVKLRYRLRAKYPIRAKTFASRVYEYYDPAVKAVARPVELEVRPK